MSSFFNNLSRLFIETSHYVIAYHLNPSKFCAFPGALALCLCTANNRSIRFSFICYYQDLFKGFPDACNLLDTLRRGALASGSSSRWDDEWSEHVLPLLTKVLSVACSLVIKSTILCRIRCLKLVGLTNSAKHD